MVTITLITLTTSDIVRLFRILHCRFPGRRFELEPQGGIRMIDYTQPVDRLFMFNIDWPTTVADTLLDWDLNHTDYMICSGYIVMQVELQGEWTPEEIDAFQVAFKKIGSIPNLRFFIQSAFNCQVDVASVFRSNGTEQYLEHKERRVELSVLPKPIVGVVRKIIGMLYDRAQLHRDLAAIFKFQYIRDIYGNQLINYGTHMVAIVLSFNHVLPQMQFHSKLPKYIVIMRIRRAMQLPYLYRYIQENLHRPPVETVIISLEEQYSRLYELFATG